MNPFNIETTRTVIRQMQMADLDNFFEYRSNPEVTKYQSFDVMTMQQCCEFIITNSSKSFGTPDEWVQYAIENKKTRQLIGDCAIKLQENDVRIAEIGITISHLEQNQGYAKEVFSGILEFLFGELSIHRIVETVDAENINSVKLLRSLGFRQEGYFIENIFFKGSWGSEYQFAMLQLEWKNLQKPK